MEKRIRRLEHRNRISNTLILILVTLVITMGAIRKRQNYDFGNITVTGLKIIDPSGKVRAEFSSIGELTLKGGIDGKSYSKLGPIQIEFEGETLGYHASFSKSMLTLKDKRKRETTVMSDGIETTVVK